MYVDFSQERYVMKFSSAVDTAYAIGPDSYARLIVQDDEGRPVDITATTLESRDTVAFNFKSPYWQALTTKQRAVLSAQLAKKVVDSEDWYVE